MFHKKEPLNLSDSLAGISTRSNLQQLKSPTSQLNIPAHVQNVQAKVTRISDVSSKVTVTFSRAVQDTNFVDARVFVTGYAGSSQPVQVGSGQSPVQFFLNNSGDAITVTVQASGQQGQAPMATAPTTTLKL